MRSKSTPRTTRLIIGLLIISTVIAWLLVFHESFTVSAFKPTGYWRATVFDKTHTQMTEEAIRQLVVSDGIIPGVTKISGSMQDAIDDIKWGNANSDLELWGKYLLDEAHFTGERLARVKQEYTANSLLLDLRFATTKSDPLERH